MSDMSETFKNILLPNARVALFAIDKDIRDLAHILNEDWRFARVVFDIREGNAESAIESYSNEDSPHLVIVQTSEINDGLTDRLEVLAGNCSEDTAAVVIGPVNDVYLYRKLIDMGVSDYLVRPVEKQVLSDLIAKILIEKLGSPGSKLIAYIGAKGGVGTSSLAQVSAVVSADAMGQKTIILDASGGRSYLSVAMGTEAVTTLHEAARACGSSDQDSFRRMIVAVSDHLSVLATGAESLLDDMVSADQFESVLNKLMMTYPVVVVDLSSSPVSLARTTLSRAHNVVIVTSPTLPSLRSARGLLQEVKALRGGSEGGVHMVLNLKGVAQGHEVSDSDIATAMKVHMDMSVPWMPKIFGEAESVGKSLMEIPAAKDILANVTKFMTGSIGLSKSQSGDVLPESPKNILGSFLGKLKSR